MTAAPSAEPVPWAQTDWSAHVHDRCGLRHLDVGEGSPLVLVHGLAGAWQWWLEVAPALAHRHRVVAVDLPGFGHSRALPEPPEMDDLADALAVLLDDLGLGPATVAGHSMGGLVTLALARRRPDLVARVVLVNAGGVPMTARQLSAVMRGLTATHRLLARPRILRALARRPRARSLLLRAGMRDPAALTIELAAEIIPLMAAPGYLDAIPAAGRAVEASRPEQVEQPVLLLWGDRDRLVPLAGAREMARRLPNGRLVVLEGVGHSPMIEAPADTARHILEFAA